MLFLGGDDEGWNSKRVPRRRRCKMSSGTPNVFRGGDAVKCPHDLQTANVFRDSDGLELGDVPRRRDIPRSRHDRLPPLENIDEQIIPNTIDGERSAVENDQFAGLYGGPQHIKIRNWYKTDSSCIGVV